MAGLAIITEACIDVKDRACVDVCPVQCIYEFDPAKNMLFSEVEAGSGVSRTRTSRIPTTVAIFADSILYVNLDECTSCTACYQPDVCPVGAIYSEEHVPERLDQERVQHGRPEQGSRPHVLHRAQPRRLRRLRGAERPGSLSASGPRAIDASRHAATARAPRSPAGRSTLAGRASTARRHGSRASRSTGHSTARRGRSSR